MTMPLIQKKIQKNEHANVRARASAKVPADHLMTMTLSQKNEHPNVRVGASHADSDE
jgi:hypothetical protein